MSYENGYIPMDKWAKDHWSTFAYIETVMVDCGGFQVGRDAMMKSNRRHFRVMAEQCPNPKRTKNTGALAICMSPEHATILNDQQQLPGHDDWCCMQDMAAQGLFDLDVDHIEPGVTLHLSELGFKVASELRRHLSNNGKMAAFSFKDDDRVEEPSF